MTVCFRFRDRLLTKAGHVKAAGNSVPAAQQRGVCFRYRDTGSCSFGDGCKWAASHGPASPSPKPKFAVGMKDVQTGKDTACIDFKRGSARAKCASIPTVRELRRSPARPLY